VTLAITWVCAARSSMKEYVRRSGWSEGAPCTRPLVTGFTSRAATSACRNMSGKSWKCAVRKESRRTWCGSWTDTSRWFTQGPTALSSNEVPQIDLQRPPPARSSAPAHPSIRALTVDHRQRPVSDSGATRSHGSIHAFGGHDPHCTAGSSHDQWSADHRRRDDVCLRWRHHGCAGSPGVLSRAVSTDQPGHSETFAAGSLRRCGHHSAESEGDATALRTRV
jgi:hypothetical protein